MFPTRTALEKGRPAAALGALMIRCSWAASGGASQAKRTRSDGSGRTGASGYGAKVTGGRGRPRRSVAEVGAGSRRQRGRVRVWWIAGSTATTSGAFSRCGRGQSGPRSQVHVSPALAPPDAESRARAMEQRLIEDQRASFVRGRAPEPRYATHPYRLPRGYANEPYVPYIISVWRHPSATACGDTPRPPRGAAH